MTLACRIIIHRHDGGIDQSSIPPSLTVDDATKQNASAASYYKRAFILPVLYVCVYVCVWVGGWVGGYLCLCVHVYTVYTYVYMSVYVCKWIAGQ